MPACVARGTSDRDDRLGSDPGASGTRAVAGAGTMGLAVVGVAIIAAGVWLPWHSPWPDPDPVATFEIAG